MADDPKQSAKTVLGWLPNGQPGQQQPPGYAPQGYPQQSGHPVQAYGQPSVYPAPAPQPAYGQPPSPQYAQPQQPPYGQPQQPPYGQPQQPQYGQPQQPPYAQPQAPQYAQPSYGQPQQPSYPSPPPQGYDSGGQSFGQAPQQSYGQSPQGYPQQGQPAHGYPQHSAPGSAPSYPQAPAGFAQGMGGYGGGYGQAAAAMPSLERPIPNANATVGVSDRVSFIRKTYVHLLGAILVFSGLLYLLLTNETLFRKVSAPLIEFGVLGPRWHWGVVLGAFMAVSWIADYWASHTTSRAMQYIGLALYVVAEALIFVPLLFLVSVLTQDILAKGGHEPHIIRDAAYTTLGIFGALTASVLISKKDFSWMRSGLVMLGSAAMMLVVLSLVFGFNLGIVFSIGMVVLAAGYILYQTSQVLAHYNPRQHVAAALALFSSIALMFWYMIRIFARLRQ
jgi:FtsH-binding integral membrane protein